MNSLISKSFKYPYNGQLVTIMGGGKKYITIPRYQYVSTGSLQEDFEDYSAWAKISGVDPAQDETHYVTGTKSVKLTNVGALSRMDKLTSPNWTLASDEHISLDVYYSSGTHPSVIVYFVGDTTFTKYFQATLTIPDGTPPNRNAWYHFDITPGDVSFTGGMTWTTTIKKLRITNVETDCDLSFDALYSGVKTTSSPAVMFSFDDGYDSVYNLAYPIFNSRAAKCTAYIIADQVDEADYMTESQILTLHNNGWIIGNHSKDTSTFNTLTESQIETSVAFCISYLQGLGITGNSPYHLAYPGGKYTPDSITALTNLNILTGRTTEAFMNYYNNAPLLYTWGIELTNTKTLASAKANVDTAILANRIPHFFGHKIVTGAPSALQWKDTDLAELLDYIRSKNVPIITIDDFYNLYSKDVRVRVK